MFATMVRASSGLHVDSGPEAVGSVAGKWLRSNFISSSARLSDGLKMRVGRTEAEEQLAIWQTHTIADPKLGKICPMSPEPRED